MTDKEDARADYSYAMHEAARRFMDLHSVDGMRNDLSLDEWLCEHQGRLRPDVYKEGSALLSCFEGYGGTA